MTRNSQESEPKKPLNKPHRGGLPRWKRGLDIFLVILFGIPLVVLGGIIAVIIKFGSRGPLLFRQRRVGYKGQEFTCLKFRTMRVDADTSCHREHTRHLIKSHDPMQKLDVRKDPRLIRLGALLRAGGLDELPQIFNVLKGEMSLVGPRPCIRYECELYEDWHWRRFDAVPGLTGLWQVSGKNRTTFEQMVKLDITYSQNLSLWLDLKIIAMTPLALIRQYIDLRAARRSEAENLRRGIAKPSRPATHLESPVSAPQLSETA